MYLTDVIRKSERWTLIVTVWTVTENWSPKVTSIILLLKVKCFYSFIPLLRVWTGIDSVGSCIGSLGRSRSYTGLRTGNDLEHEKDDVVYEKVLPSLPSKEFEDNFDEYDSTTRKKTDPNLKDLETDLCFTNPSGHKPLFMLPLPRHTPRCPRVAQKYWSTSLTGRSNGQDTFGYSYHGTPFSE